MNDDTLTLYYCNDGLSAHERRQVEEALAADAELAERYRTLSESLAGLRDTESEPLPDDMLQRFHATVDNAARLERGRESTRSGFHFGSFFWGAAVTAALAVGIGIGVLLGNGDDAGSPDPMVVGVPAAAGNPGIDATPVFFRSFENHLRQSSRDINALPVHAEADRFLMILRLIEQNRFFERAAAQNESPELARVLRAFEPILLKLAADDITPEEAAELRSQLSFELNVMLTKLSHGSSDGQDSHEERT